MIRVDYSKALEEVDRNKPSSVLVVAPDGLLKEAQNLVDILEAKGIEAIISGEACYGSCDLKEYVSEAVKADLIIHIGHTLRTNRVGRRTILIAAEDDIEFGEVISKASENLRKYRKVGLYTITQHLHKLPEAKRLFEELGLKVEIEGGEKLSYGQILGCEFQPAYSVKDDVEAFVFLGQSRFHATALALSTGKPTYMLDPYLNEVVDATPLAEEARRRSLLAVYKAREAERFGVIIGLREGQMRLHHVKRIREGLAKHGKYSTLIAMREITPERVNTFTWFDAFIQTACPRISIDGLGFNKPVLSTPQAYALLNLLEGKELEDFLLAPSWI
ncbi:MAG: diphthamide biosynthesis enzyme Dph2 [Nitrososphaerales archaeon]